MAAAHKQGRPGNKKMALIGSVYSVDPYPRLPEQILSSLFRDASDPSSLPKSKRPPPKHKRVRGALLRNAQGKTDPQSDEIFGWMADEVRQRGLPGKKTLVMIMDGQESLWSSGLKQLPEERFIITEILDLIHVTSYIWTASHVFHRKGSPEAIAFAKQQIRCLLNNGANEVIDCIFLPTVATEFCVAWPPNFTNRGHLFLSKRGHFFDSVKFLFRAILPSCG